ncbi:MAG: tetratricopeptide repeat protein [Verrucomicrobiae bacterium]|nr:tetratricopeptide repeat protein [Verrucomicrobiae bacterium]MDW8343223.1 tetratricopeptide repeat protein [Verrucomicrobiae bacterium]
MKNQAPLLLGLLLLTACGRATDPARDYQTAIELYREQKYARALARFEPLAQTLTNHPQLFHFIGVCHLHLGQTSEAVPPLRRAIEVQPDYTLARYHLGLALLELNQTSDAVAELRQVARAADAPEHALFDLGRAYLRMSAFAQAEQVFSQYLRTHSNSVEATYLLAWANLRRGDHASAHRLFQRVTELAPDTASAYLNLAILEQLHLNRPADARQHYRRYLELTDDSELKPAIEKQLAKLFAPPPPPASPSPTTAQPATAPSVQPTPPPASASPTTAPAPAPVAGATPPVPTPSTPPAPTPVTEPARKTRPPIPVTPPPSGDRNRAILAFNRGVQLQQTGPLSAAIAAYQEAIQLDPSFAAAHYNLAICYRANNQPERALEHYERALQAFPDYTDARFNYAILLQEQGYLDDAIVQLERIVAANPAYAPARLSLASLYAQNRATRQKAREHYQQYLRLDPNSPLARDIRRWLDQNR